jgi:Family of unknown function (DUF6932)
MAEVRKRCVDAFPLSKSRPTIMRGLEGVVGRLVHDHIVGSLWIDGSFLTEKIDPEDVDLLLQLSIGFVQAMTPAQFAAVQWYVEPARRTTHWCDTYRTTWFPVGHPNHPRWLRMRDYWARQYGFSRKNEAKGIAIVELTGGAP